MTSTGALTCCQNIRHSVSWTARPRRALRDHPAVRSNVAFAAAVETALSYGLSKSAQATRRAAWAQWIAFTDANDIRHGDFSDTTNALWMVFMANHPSGKSYSAATIRTYASAIKSVVLESGIMPASMPGRLSSQVAPASKLCTMAPWRALPLLASANYVRPAPPNDSCREGQLSREGLYFSLACEFFVHPRVKQLDRVGYALGRDECPHERGVDACPHKH